MKTIIARLLFIALLGVWACGQKSHDHEGHDHEASHAVENSGNDALYSEVMKIHDEVMPRMNEMYSLKQELTNKMTDSLRLPDDKKKEIASSISNLDSASEGMMVWMRQFNPIPDSLGKEKAREYLETEMEKIKKVREDINEAIEKAKTIHK